jgi:hypothetical protein
MQQAMDLMVRVGSFAALVIAVVVAIMLLISFVERDRRPNDSGKHRKK